jgi:hypothetical protein
MDYVFGRRGENEAEGCRADRTREMERRRETVREEREPSLRVGFKVN